MIAIEAALAGQTEDQPGVDYVLDAIDKLLDAMEGLQAPLTRELLGCAMMALVHECRLNPRVQLN